MTVLDLVLHPDDRLREVCKEVETVDASIQKLVDDMLETMYDAPGIGLAAPQIGRMLRIAVVDVRDDGDDEDAEERSEDEETEDKPETRSSERTEPYVLINPEILHSEGSVVTEEGCLSIPGVFADVVRPEKIRVRALNREGETYEIEADGLLSVCIQHEIDHLNGVLFLDHLSRLKLRMAMKTYRRTLPAFLKEQERKKEKRLEEDA